VLPAEEHGFLHDRPQAPPAGRRSPRGQNEHESAAPAEAQARLPSQSDEGIAHDIYKPVDAPAFIELLGEVAALRYVAWIPALSFPVALEAGQPVNRTLRG